MILLAGALGMVIYEFFSDDSIFVKLFFLALFGLAYFLPVHFAGTTVNIIAIGIHLLLIIILFFKNGLYKR